MKSLSAVAQLRDLSSEATSIGVYCNPSGRVRRFGRRSKDYGALITFSIRITRLTLLLLDTPNPRAPTSTMKRILTLKHLVSNSRAHATFFSISSNFLQRQRRRRSAPKPRTPRTTKRKKRKMTSRTTAQKMPPTNLATATMGRMLVHRQRSRLAVKRTGR